ncbi:beta-eliminating lyase-related protein, partial [Klebsiella pneumoniae]|nr:beta-eliminating lyase-related protein [Klebsiella pneumoniae]MCP6663563.1 beta-eliminating lyase-related protein [Klebsiella pneumoniae]
METNEEQTPGYGMDEHCERARAYIRKACHVEEADIHFLVGGTQTNTTIISSILRPHQGAVAAITGHIAIHETGAIEATGHKVLT